jgi:hypothetical protein
MCADRLRPIPQAAGPWFGRRQLPVIKKISGEGRDNGGSGATDHNPWPSGNVRMPDRTRRRRGWQGECGIRRQPWNDDSPAWKSRNRFGRKPRRTKEKHGCHQCEADDLANPLEKHHGGPPRKIWPATFTVTFPQESAYDIFTTVQTIQLLRATPLIRNRARDGARQAEARNPSLKNTRETGAAEPGIAIAVKRLARARQPKHRPLKPRLPPRQKAPCEAAELFSRRIFRARNTAD